MAQMNQLKWEKTMTQVSIPGREDTDTPLYHTSLYIPGKDDIARSKFGRRVCTGILIELEIVANLIDDTWSLQCIGYNMLTTTYKVGEVFKDFKSASEAMIYAHRLVDNEYFLERSDIYGETKAEL
jgi:hypothetical protein